MASAQHRPPSSRWQRVMPAVAVALLIAGCSSDAPEPAGGGDPVATAETDGGGGQSGAGDGSTGEPPGPAREELREAIATWYFEEGPSDTQARADCVADAMLDSATVEELADLGVTVETIDELFLGPLGNNEAFVDGVVACVARFP